MKNFVEELKWRGMLAQIMPGTEELLFGYATNETENYMPLSLDLAHRILRVLAEIRREGKVMTYLRPDAKSQVTIEYDDKGFNGDTSIQKCQFTHTVRYTIIVINCFREYAIVWPELLAGTCFVGHTNLFYIIQWLAVSVLLLIYLTIAIYLRYHLF